jgi:hypothetical protein
MKELNTNTLGVVELNKKELKDTQGGFFILGFLIGAAIGYALMDWIFGD